jgi:membrane protein implicated in regulation of membrane protease activity
MAVARPLPAPERARPSSATTQRLRELAGAARPVALAEERVLPVLPPIQPLLVGGGLRRGTTAAVVGSTSLALALVAGPSAAGSWTAAVGLPSLGVVAAAEVGVDLERLALVPAPGDQWATVTAALLDAVDVVLVRPSRRVRQADARRLVARARERGAVLVPLSAWDGADVQLSIGAATWRGLGRGTGHLAGREVEVVASGRGAAARQRRATLWLA